MRLFAFLFFLMSANCKTLLQNENECDTVYQVVDEAPVYKSGQTDLIDAVKKFRFSKYCKPEEVRQITWVLNASGKVISVDVLGAKSDCLKEIQEQARQLSPWAPGKLKGKPVCVKVVLPIKIWLTD